MNASLPLQKTRRYELDWLRVLAILAIFVFHSARFFDRMDWHVKNAKTYSGLELPAMYEFLIRRHNVLRFLFGMKSLQPASPLGALQQPAA
jgi:hypothetical protein